MKNLKFSISLSLALINSIFANPSIALIPENALSERVTCKQIIGPCARTTLAIGGASAIGLLTGPSILNTLALGVAGTVVYKTFNRFPSIVTIPSSAALATGGAFIDNTISNILENEGAPGFSIMFTIATFEFLLQASNIKVENSAFAKWGNKMTNCFQRCWKRCRSRCTKADFENLARKEEQLSELELVQTQLREKGLESVVLSLQGKFVSLNESIESLKRDLESKRKELDTYYDVIRTANLATPTRPDAAASSSQASSPESVDVEATRSESRTPSPELEKRSPLRVPLLPSPSDD